MERRCGRGAFPGSARPREKRYSQGRSRLLTSPSAYRRHRLIQPSPQLAGAGYPTGLALCGRPPINRLPLRPFEISALNADGEESRMSAGNRLFLPFAICAALAAPPFAAQAAQQGVTEDAITIGAFGPITGPAAYIGLAGRDGAALAIKEINAAGGINGRK